MVLSLFGGNRHMHHFATEHDVAEELFALLSEARVIYLQDVIKSGKRYDRYVDDFVHSHRYINCNNAVCRNCHEMNIHIVKGLLHDCAGLVRKYFTADSFSFEDCMRLKWKYNFYESSSPGSPGADNPTRVPPLSFGCNFSREQMKDIVACSKTGSSSRTGSPFLTRGGSLCQRTAGRMSPPQACPRPCLSRG